MRYRGFSAAGIYQECVQHQAFPVSPIHTGDIEKDLVSRNYNVKEI